MLILHDENNLVTGLQLFPSISDQPHIFAHDSLFDLLKPLVGKISLVKIGDNLFLPENIKILSTEGLLQSVKQEKIAQINTCFANSMSQGANVNFNGTIEVIQTRNERDINNISSILSRATFLQLHGIVELIYFRVQSNTVYKITPAFAIEMCEVVLSSVQRNLEKCWQLKDAIQQAETVQEVEAIVWTMNDV
jgi:Domain of unknown function (DUF4376)